MGEFLAGVVAVVVVVEVVVVVFTGLLRSIPV